MKYLLEQTDLILRNCKSLRVVLIFVFLSALLREADAQLSPPEKSSINSMLPQPFPKSPNVAALGKFGDYPVNFFTGIPDISIPIFEVTSGELHVPITLSYHPSGIKPSDNETWVGLGWSLSAGGNISRSVMGKRDEEDFYTRTLVATPDACRDFNYLKSSALSTIDTQPDVFSYSFPGKGGKFMLIEGGTQYLIPYAPIVVNETFASNSFTKFEITDEHGILYRFGTGANLQTSTEYTSSTSGGNPTLGATTAWHLMDMESPNSDDKISFSYQELGNASTYESSYYLTTQTNCGGYTQDYCPSPQPLATQSVSISTVVNQQAVATIMFETGKVEFITTSNTLSSAKSLDKINIYSLINGQYKLLKTIKFIYGNFSVPDNGYRDANGNPQMDPIRDKLAGLQVLDASGKIIQNYKFSYFTDSFSWGTAYSNDTRARDMWGYYNGSDKNRDLIIPRSIYVQSGSQPTGSWVTIGGAVDRTVHSAYAKEGVLKRIDFPTGGFTEFDFESNQYYNYFNAPGTPTLAGGLRVTSITSHDGNGSPSVVKKYKYGSGGVYGSGVGTANFSPYSINYSSVQEASLRACNADFNGYFYTTTTYYSTSAYATDPFDSSPVVYPNVTEYYGDPDGNNIGRIEYEYDRGLPQTDVDQIVQPSNKYYRNSYFWKRGRLTHKTTYDNANHKLSEVITDYSEFKSTDKIIGLGAFQYNLYLGPYCRANSECVTPTGEVVDVTDYRFQQFSQRSGAWLETFSKEIIYDRSDLTKFVTHDAQKIYDPNTLQVLQTTSTGGNNDQIVTVNRYPFQLTSSSSSTGNALGIQKLKVKNMVATPIETYSYRQNVDGSNARIISAQVTSYRQNVANANHVVPDKIYVWESSSVIPKASYVPVSVKSNSSLTLDARQKERINMVSYDAAGHIKEVQKTNDQRLVYLWGYNNTLPVAEVVNSAAKNVFYTSFEEDVTNVIVEGKTGDQSASNGFTKSLTGLDAGSYRLTYYQKQAGVWNQIIATVTVASTYTISLNGQVDEVRFYPVNATMTTYTHNSLYGITSVTDPNGVTTTYKYDLFGRLNAVKDNDQSLMKVYKYNYANPN